MIKRIALNCLWVLALPVIFLCGVAIALVLTFTDRRDALATFDSDRENS